MKLNQKDPMQTEDKESIRQFKITFQIKTKQFYFFCSRRYSADFLDMTSNTIQRMSFSSPDTINQHFFSYCFPVGSL